MHLLAWFFLLLGAAVAAPDPYRIEPGRGFGSFGPQLTLAEIEKKLPQGQYMEGETGGRKSVTLYAMEPGRRVTVFFHPQGRIRSMLIHGYESVWHTRQGIGLGTTLAALEKANGGPFKYRSLGMGEGSGQVIDWRGGKLSKPFQRVKITFAAAMHSKGYATLNDAEHQRVEAEGQVLSSADPLSRKLNPIVETLELEF
jgi:hypothetical protein